MVGIREPPGPWGWDQQPEHFEGLEQLPCSGRENKQLRVYTPPNLPTATALSPATVSQGDITPSPGHIVFGDPMALS